MKKTFLNIFTLSQLVVLATTVSLFSRGKIELFKQLNKEKNVSYNSQEIKEFSTTETQSIQRISLKKSALKRKDFKEEFEKLVFTKLIYKEESDEVNFSRTDKENLNTEIIKVEQILTNNRLEKLSLNEINDDELFKLKGISINQNVRVSWSAYLESKKMDTQLLALSKQSKNKETVSVEQVAKSIEVVNVKKDLPLIINAEKETFSNEPQKAALKKITKLETKLDSQKTKISSLDLPKKTDFDQILRETNKELTAIELRNRKIDSNLKREVDISSSVSEVIKREMIKKKPSLIVDTHKSDLLKKEKEDFSYTPKTISLKKVVKLESKLDGHEMSIQPLSLPGKTNFDQILEDTNKELLAMEDNAKKQDTEASRESEISSSVTNVIEREMVRKNSAQKMNTQKVIQKVASQMSATKSKSSPEYSKNSFTVKGDGVNIRIKSFGIDLIDKSSEDLIGFDFSPAYQNGEIRSDEGEGYVDYTFKLTGDFNHLKGSVRANQDYIVTNVDLSLEDGIQYYVPLFNRDAYYKFLENKKLNGIGGDLLVEKGDLTHSLTIDSGYEEKFYFTENFEETIDQTQAVYILFVGVKAGNALLSYKTVEDEIIDKIINITEDEIYFETNDYRPGKKEFVELFEKNILSKELSLLELGEEEFKYFNTSIFLTKEAQNRYEYLRPRMSLGMRKYLELKRNESLLIVGYGSNNKIEIPNERLISEYLRLLQLDSLDGSCVIQVNISDKKEIKDILYTGHTENGDTSNMYLDQLAVDKDGQSGKEIINKSKNILITGNQQGTISFKVEYQDGSSRFFNSFCSPGTYLIEQL